jgi:hypothetical protein
MFTLLCAALLVGEVPKPFGIQIVDDRTKRGIPLVELRTTHNLRFVTDSQGWVAIDEPDLSGQDVFFEITSHGYEFPKDGFGIRGKAVRVQPGGEVQLSMTRRNIAERLSRVTGAGIFADSVKLGKALPFDQPTVNAGVFGSDSILNVVYRGKLYWIWGDTNRAAYPLGNFQVTGATTDLPSKIDPAVGFRFDYFTDGKGFVKPMAPIAGEGPTWIESLVVLPDQKNQPRMYGSYVKVKEGLKVYARGIVIFHDQKKVFEKLQDLPLDGVTIPKGHGYIEKDYYYLGNPFPTFRVKADLADYLEPSNYEGFTCVDPSTGRVERNQDGRAVYAWRKSAKPLTPEEENRLIKSGQLKPDEAMLHVRNGSAFIEAHGGSVAWNAYRKKYVTVFNQIRGKSSNLGEVWYAEADSPTGPWKTAVKIATHDRMDFYNPKLHPDFDRDAGRFIHFEGTYTNTFSGNPDRTPRYEYNQILYRLDLGDPRLRGTSKE